MDRRVLVVLLLLVSVQLLCAGENRQITIRGMVTDSEGAIVRDAFVVAHWDSSGATVGLKDNPGTLHDVTLSTDVNGEFSAELPPGFYDIFVAAAGFSPECRKVRLKVGPIENFRVSLKADPLVTRELGSPIPK